MLIFREIETAKEEERQQVLSTCGFLIYSGDVLFYYYYFVLFFLYFYSLVVVAVALCVTVGFYVEASEARSLIFASVNIHRLCKCINRTTTLSLFFCADAVSLRLLMFWYVIHTPFHRYQLLGNISKIFALHSLCRSIVVVGRCLYEILVSLSLFNFILLYQSSCSLVHDMPAHDVSFA